MYGDTIISSYIQYIYLFYLALFNLIECILYTFQKYGGIWNSSREQNIILCYVMWLYHSFALYLSLSIPLLSGSGDTY